MTARFPFSAVVGHDDLRLALLLNAVHPGIGGVLVRGEKGTAKSTIVRGLAALLPAVKVVEACRFACDPAAPDPACPEGPHHTAAAVVRRARLVELPVGATEDRLVGSLDLERALTEGVRAYQPGLLAAAHRGVLYVDEVNLLHDHLVDLLLDAAAMGRAHVERDGVSVAHAASFLLVGTMNPEEGELRPQLLDRFGLTVSVAAARDVPTRTEVIRRRLAYESDSAGFAARWGDADAELAARITAARSALVSVGLPDGELRRIAAVCAAFEVDGMRADLVLARTALAHAAWRGGDTVTEADVEVAARLALPHRRRRDPFDEPGMDAEALRQALEDAAQYAEQAPAQDSPAAGDAPAGPAPAGDGPTGEGSAGEGSAGDRPTGDGPDEGGPDNGPGGGADPGAPQAAAGQSTSQSTLDGAARAPGERAPAVPAPAFRARLLQVPGVGDGAPGRRSRSRSRAGRVVRASTAEGNGLHLPGTLAAAAPHQLERGRSGPGLVLRRGDLRRAVHEGKEGNVVLFVVDASGSMAARTRMSAVSGAVLSLLRDAYQRRDKVGLVTFRGADAELVLPPTSSVDAAAARLRQLRTGGRTPLAGGLLRARRVLAAERLRDPLRRPLLVVVTDGRATAAATPGADNKKGSTLRAGLGANGSTVRAGLAVSDALRAAALLAQDRVAAVVVDCEHGPVRLGLAVALAAVLDAACVRLDELSAEGVAGVVQAARGSGRRVA